MTYIAGQTLTAEDLNASFADKVAVADLASDAAGKGASLVGYETTGETVKGALDARLPEIGTYALLRAYSGALTAFYVRGVANLFDGGHGVFRVNAADTTSADNGGTMLVDAAGRRWKREYSGPLDLAWFCALDGSTDDTAQIQAAADIGGDIALYRGIARTTSKISITKPNTRFVGGGKRNCQVPLEVAPFSTVEVGGTIFADHDGHCIELDSLYNVNGFGLSGVTLLGRGGAGSVGVAFAKSTADFRRDFSFHGATITGFWRACDTARVGAYAGDSAWGMMRITECSIMHNHWIATTSWGQWNGFVFERNDAGQNGYAAGDGGILVSGHDVKILNNILEGQRDAVQVVGNYYGAEVVGNYFEANVGDYCIKLSNTIGARLASNSFRNVTASDKVVIFATVDTISDDYDAPTMIGESWPKIRHGRIAMPGANAGTGVLLRYENVRHIFAPDAAHNLIYQPGLTPTAPMRDLRDSAGSAYSTSGTGLIAYTKTGLALPIGSYIAVAVAVSYDAEPALEPRIELRVNSTNTDGDFVAVFYNWNKGGERFSGRTVVYFAIVKATNAVASMQAYFYPYGISPAAGLTCAISAPYFYDLGTAPGDIEPFLAMEQLMCVSAMPAAGTWATNTKLRAVAPSAGGPEGWICIGGGTPGTWKTFGQIGA